MAYLVIRVRGTINIKPKIKETLNYLNLTRVNHAVIVPETDTYKGMLQKAKDYVTWGEAKPEVLAKLIKFRGKLTGDIPITDKYIKGMGTHTSIMAFSVPIETSEAAVCTVSIPGLPAGSGTSSRANSPLA